MRLKVLTSFGNSNLTASAGEEITVDDEKFAKALLQGGIVEEIQSDSSTTVESPSTPVVDTPVEDAPVADSPVADAPVADEPTPTSDDQPESESSDPSDQEDAPKTETNQGNKSNKSKKGKK